MVNEVKLKTVSHFSGDSERAMIISEIARICCKCPIQTKKKEIDIKMHAIQNRLESAKESKISFLFRGWQILALGGSIDLEAMITRSKVFRFHLHSDCFFGLQSSWKHVHHKMLQIRFKVKWSWRDMCLLNVSNLFKSLLESDAYVPPDFILLDSNADKCKTQMVNESQDKKIIAMALSPFMTSRNPLKIFRKHFSTLRRARLFFSFDHLTPLKLYQEFVSCFSLICNIMMIL